MITYIGGQETLYCSHETVPVEQQTTDDTLQVKYWQGFGGTSK